ncbi:MAG: hypothetical protein EBS05_10020 [Proteobacteria bacterium]|nr:hypothetical protein [Pseudomonadota bacterium]
MLLALLLHSRVFAPWELRQHVGGHFTPGDALQLLRLARDGSATPLRDRRKASEVFQLRAHLLHILGELTQLRGQLAAGEFAGFHGASP